MLAGSTGLEPAASGVTGRRSNQLNYDPEREVLFSAVARVLRAETRLRSRHVTRERCEAKAGGRYRTRTCDSRCVRPVLYQLS